MYTTHTEHKCEINAQLSQYQTRTRQTAYLLDNNVWSDWLRQRE